MAKIVDLVVRLRVARETGVITADLASELEAALVRLAPAAGRRAVRDQHLRRAAGFMSGSLYAKAQRLAQETTSALRPGRISLPPDPTGVRAAVLDAVATGVKMPTSWRQFHTLLDPELDEDEPPIEV
ncbi:hypothetical protein [Stigmatella erecta]|uniref:Uncharacterized protein n=1 Tax=Stigmatella erecta TaxID=83460 RepID=A0A1I0J9Y8_9BACT|nr:hypothetical protein [Stigmatella erecta]SEU06810.1 hypothetical protein SAMN05443639_10792 [Stigmatella erecta]